MTRWALQLLGSPRLERDGVVVAIDTRKALALAAYLVMTGQRHGREALAALLWPDYADARAALRRTLSSLTHAMDGIGLVADRDTIALVPHEALTVDVIQFRRLLQAARHGQAATEPEPARIAQLTEAVALYRDDFLTGLVLRDAPAYDDWRFFQAEGLRGELADALDRLAQLQARIGAFEPAITHARRRVALDPLHEPGHRALMEFYARAGQRAAALRQYQRCARLLQTELGELPQAETTALNEAIRANTVATSAPTVATRVGATTTLPDAIAPMGPGHDRPLPLVGREAEWALVMDRHAATGPDGHLVAIEGEAGIGKTRLVEETLAAVRQRGATTLTIRCFADQDRLAYGPIAEAMREALSRPDTDARLRAVAPHWLVEAARLVPEVAGRVPDLPPAPPLDSIGGQARFIEGLAQVLLALVDGPISGVVAFDDLHWADSATLDLVTYLVRRLRGRPLLLIATWRGEEIALDHRIRQLLADALRAGSGRHLVLDRLTPMDVQSLSTAATLPGQPLPVGVVERIYAETEGLPFFLIEYLAAVARGDAVADGVGWTMPATVRALLHARLAGVTAEGQHLLATAAVIGRSCDADMLLAACHQPEEDMVAALEAVLARGLLRELGDDRQATYDFSHEQLRALVYAETSHARRRLLHRRVADLLAADDASPAPASRVAYHYERAGQRPQAAQWYGRAGDHARGLYANAQALTHYETALALGHPVTSDLHEAIGDLQTLLGNYAAAITSYDAAVATADPRRRGILARKLGAVYHRRGELARAEAQFMAARDALVATGGDNELARLHADWSLTAYRQGDSERAASLAQHALTLAEVADDARAMAQAHNALGMLASGRGDLVEARQHLQQSLTLATSLNDPSAQVAALNNLSLVAEAGGETRDALALAEAALTLCAAQGDHHHEAALHSRLADLLHGLGHLDPAMAHLKEAVTIFAEIGVEAGAVQPHIWTLTEW